MFGWVVRLFPTQSLRAENDMLRAQLSAAESDVTAARDEIEILRHESAVMSERLDAAITDKEGLWEMTQKAIEGERFANHTAYNHEVQRHGGGIPYPDAHALPPNMVPPVQKTGTIGRKGRMLTSQAVFNQSRAHLIEYINSQQAGQAETPPA